MLGGMLVTVLGILLVMSERLPHDRVDRRTFWEGIGLGLFSTLAEVVGVVVSRGVLARTSIEPSWSALLRLASAAVAAWILMGLTRQKIGVWSRDGRLLGLPNGVAHDRHPHLDARQQLGLLIAAGVFSGTFIGVWLQQAALKVTEAGVAQTLFATSPLFILVLLAILQRKLPSLRAFSGVVIAIGGVALLFFG
jgi:drug/metabolite transporter (DMT)-like permease